MFEEGKEKETKPVFSGQDPSLVTDPGARWGHRKPMKIKPRWHPRTAEWPEEQLGHVLNAPERFEALALGALLDVRLAVEMDTSLLKANGKSACC